MRFKFQLALIAVALGISGCSTLWPEYERPPVELPAPAHGARKVVPSYNVMGPLKTRAASGLKDFDLLLNAAVERSPVGQLVDIMDVGFACAYLATPYARRMTGETLYVDGGVNIMA